MGGAARRVRAVRCVCPAVIRAGWMGYGRCTCEMPLVPDDTLHGLLSRYRSDK
jgi:hypothetical protein